MTTLTISIIVVFVLGYALIATESLTKVNKAAIALLMLVGCWTLYMVDPMQYLQMMHPDYTGGAAGMVEKVTGIIQEHLGDTAWRIQLGSQGDEDKVEACSAVAHSLPYLLPFSHPRQPDYQYRDDYDSAQARYRPQGPYGICLACHHCSQLGWRFLAHRRRYHHHALEQGTDNRSWCDRRDLPPICGFHGDSCLDSSDHVEGRTRDA